VVLHIEEKKFTLTSKDILQGLTKESSHSLNERCSTLMPAKTMKLVLPRVALFVLFTVIAAAAEQSSPRAVPQPRVRLHPSPQGPVARVEKAANAPVSVMLEKVVVTESKLPQGQSDEVPADPKRFTVSGGGTIFTGRIGDAPYSFGLWPRYDLFWKDSRFKPQKTRVDIEVVRVKL
jgi:hypothetical protein